MFRSQDTTTKMKRIQNWLLTCWLIYFSIEGINTVRIRQLHVPAAIHKGNSIQLHCEFELQHSLLYSVKFYKDYIEFYRYLPSLVPQAKMFKLKGVYVDIDNSNASHVTLTSTDLESQGTYACEVSTEAPDFSTVQAEKQMKVYVLPEDLLKIEGTEPTYEMHNLINLTCVSGASYPAQTLTWFINEERASARHLIYYTPVANPSNALIQSSRLGLRLTANDAKFKRGLLKLVCQSALTLVYEYETYQTLSGGTQPRNKLLVTSGGTSGGAADQVYSANNNENAHYLKQTSLTTNLPEHEASRPAGDSNGPDEDVITWKNDPRLLLKVSRDAPLITGGKEKYRVGSILNVNCSAAPDAHLSWYIKGRMANESQLVRYANGVNPCCSILGLKFRMVNRHFQMQELKLSCVAKHFKTITTYSKQLNIRTIGALANSKLESGAEGRNRKLWRIQNVNSGSSLDCSLAFSCVYLIAFIILNYLISPT